MGPVHNSCLQLHLRLSRVSFMKQKRISQMHFKRIDFSGVMDDVTASPKNNCLNSVHFWAWWEVWLKVGQSFFSNYKQVTSVLRRLLCVARRHQMWLLRFTTAPKWWLTQELKHGCWSHQVVLLEKTERCIRSCSYMMLKNNNPNAKATKCVHFYHKLTRNDMCKNENKEIKIKCYINEWCVLRLCFPNGAFSVGGDLQVWFTTHTHTLDEKYTSISFVKSPPPHFFPSQRRGSEKEEFLFLQLAKLGYEDKAMEIICSANMLSVQGFLEKAMLKKMLLWYRFIFFRTATFETLVPQLT